MGTLSLPNIYKLKRVAIIMQAKVRAARVDERKTVVWVKTLLSSDVVAHAFDPST